MKDFALQARGRISAKRMAADVQALASLGPRHAGTEREHQASSYVFDQFKNVAGDVRKDKVDNIISWKLKDCRVRVVEPVEQELTSIALLGSGSTHLAAQPRSSATLETGNSGISRILTSLANLSCGIRHGRLCWTIHQMRRRLKVRRICTRPKASLAQSNTRGFQDASYRCPFCQGPRVSLFRQSL